MLNKKEFAAVAAGDYDAYRRAALRRTIRSFIVTLAFAGIVGGALAYPAYRDAQRFASLDIDSAFTAFGIRR